MTAITPTKTPPAASSTYQSPCAGSSARTIPVTASASAPHAVTSAPATLTASAWRALRASTTPHAVTSGSASAAIISGSITQLSQQAGVAGAEVLVDLGAERRGDHDDDDEVEH